MKMKLAAIWKILTNKHFLLMTRGGGFVGVMPKNTKQDDLMQKLGDKLVQIQHEGHEESVVS